MVGRVLTGPAVVGLRGRESMHLVDEPDAARHLVAGQVLAGVLDEIVVGRRGALTRLHDGRDLLAETLVGDTDHEHVEHIRDAP